MSEYVIIAGHGRNRDGSWDSGAIGFDGTQEANYVRDKIIANMKKYVPNDKKFRFVTDRNVYNYGSMADYKGKVVVEVHLDAFTPAARAGHVIIHADYAPDSIDLAIRDVIAKYVGVRYNHKGHKGISGRADLKNPNLAKNNKINYRLIECAFISNKQDMDLLNKNLDAFCRDLVKAICGSYKEIATPNQPSGNTSNQSTYKVLNGDTLWNIAQKFNTSVANIKAWNNLSSDLITPNQVLKVVKPVKPATPKPVVQHKPKPIVEKVYKERGTFYMNDTIYVRDTPSTSGNIVATYHKGENVTYDVVHMKNGYVWLEYARSGGGKGYIPCREYNVKGVGTLWGTIR